MGITTTLDASNSRDKDQGRQFLKTISGGKEMNGDISMIQVCEILPRSRNETSRERGKGLIHQDPFTALGLDHVYLAGRVTGLLIEGEGRGQTGEVLQLV